jgi:5-formyltetrahydrofolate cyclo-ligase
MEAKAELRRAVKERLIRLDANDRRVESNVIIRNLEAMLEGKKTIAVYLPYVDEPDIVPLITKLLERKNVVCMPKVEMNHMVFHRIRSLKDMEKNAISNIPEPTTGDAIDEASIDAVIVPGRAFTKEGKRMGRGSGGFDHWIRAQRKRNPATAFIGVCFVCQLFGDIPMEAHDERVDVVITSR